MAGDHGIAQQGVSAYPAEVTPQMVLNFLRGGAAINVLARHIGARVVVVDMGVASELPAHPDLVNAKIALGTRYFSREPAMLHLIITGRDAPQELIDFADLVTEMMLIKHPFEQGVLAQPGIEF